MNKAINVIAVITALPGHVTQVEQALRECESAVQHEPGCEFYQLNRDLHHADQFIMLERWHSVEMLEQHKLATAFIKLNQQLADKAKVDIRVAQPL